MPLLDIKSISKAYHEDVVLEDVSFSVEKGEIYGILGVNGSGKSTLVRMLSGDIRPDSGEIYFDSTRVDWQKPLDAINCNISAVHQSFELIDDLTVAENVFIYGCSYRSRGMKRFSIKKMCDMCHTVFCDLGIDIPPKVRARELDNVTGRIVKLAAAFAQSPALMIIDEPFLMLSDSECNEITAKLLAMKNKGISIIFTTGDISHTKGICDKIAILKEGHVFEQKNIADKSIDFFIREISDTATFSYPRITNRGTRKVLSLKNVSSRDNKLKDICFDLYSGEILGVTGAPGAGKSTLANIIFGAERIRTGALFVNGISCRFSEPADAVKHRIGLLSVASGRAGLISEFTVAQNISLASLDTVSEYGVLNAKKERDSTQKLVKKYGIIPSDVSLRLSDMQEGQRQKTVFCKWLLRGCSILIVDNATKGLDISSKVEIYNLMNSHAMNGGSILFISSDHNELLGMCDRLLILRGGCITGVADRTDFSMRGLVDLLSR